MNRNENNGLNISITQNQNQNVHINLQVLLEAIQYELNGKQLEEVQTIIDNNELESTEKKQSIVNKIASFGKDVASNILANILTNPQIFG